MESLNPIELNKIPQVGGLVTQRVSIDEVHTVDLQIIKFLMEGRVKMNTYNAPFNICSDVPQVCLAPVHQSNMLLTGISAASRRALNFTSVVYVCAISTIFCFADIHFYIG